MLADSVVEENRFVRGTPAYRSLVDEGLVIGSVETDHRMHGAEDTVVLEHPKIPFWSYPYEWSFRLLQAAAVAHLDIQLRLLPHGIALSDASAYNVQFLGPRPVFIDALSFRRYRENEHWMGARQFQEQFLHPLLLESLTGAAIQSFYRGSAEGIPCETVSSLLPLRHRVAPRILLSVTLPALLNRRFSASTAGRSVEALEKGLPRPRYEARLIDLRDWIRNLPPPVGFERVECIRSSSRI